MENIIDIKEYLKQHEDKDMLRFITCGSVDDGKSTLIGRMLYDTKMVFEDQLSAVESESKKYGTTGDKLDLALLVDGLQSEREQGITIDVAYRFFTTQKRKFIIADTPGHEQYTRNMVTGASTAEVAIILIDARKGILTQTRRHSFIVNLLGIKNIIVAINKMDLVEYSKEIYEEIKNNYEKLADELGIKNRYFIPLSALNGDNVVDKSRKISWYKGKSLLELLDTIDVRDEVDKEDFRFPVQYVNRPNLNFRGFCGTIASGSVKVGDEITILPSKITTKVKSIINAGDITEKHKDITTKEAYSSMAITITTTDEVDISRGDIIVHSKNTPSISNQFEVMLVWMDDNPMILNKTYDIKRETSIIPANFKSINYKVDINTYNKNQVDRLKLNDIASCTLQLNELIASDIYKKNKKMGSFIVIDRTTNATVGVGMVTDINKTDYEKQKDTNLFELWNNKKQFLEKTRKTLWFKEGEIVYINMGKNIGFEQDGKGKDFLRPVLIYKKFNSEQFIGFALTSQQKKGKFYVELSHNGRVSYAILSQIRTYSAKRISHKIAHISNIKLKEVHDKFISLVTP